MSLAFGTVIGASYVLNGVWRTRQHKILSTVLLTAWRFFLANISFLWQFRSNYGLLFGVHIFSRSCLRTCTMMQGFVTIKEVDPSSVCWVEEKLLFVFCMLELNLLPNLREVILNELMGKYVFFIITT